ncbi:MAG: hypothetical protein PSN37_04825 [Alphaproteobacteria bacterium]|nr:hypothetical protein [Alphaproteobacteria bacterium]
MGKGPRIFTKTKTYMAPSGGWVTNVNLANQPSGSALVLENFFPTERGILPRGGARRHAVVPGKVESLFEFRASKERQFFAATKKNIYLFGPQTKATDKLPTVVTGQTGGIYSVLEMQTDEASFLSIINGHDPLQLYDGVKWQQVTAHSSPYAISNIDTSLLSFNWVYRNRQFFIQKGTMNVWYLGINSVAGYATKLPLAGIFVRGGQLLFGTTWSSDSGAGMDDRCVFATDRGEFAVFSGDPIDQWLLIGIYDVGIPLGNKGFMSVGGDVIIATKGGMFPISSVVQKGLNQLKLSSLSECIDTDWRKESCASVSSVGWRLVKWEKQNMAFATSLGVNDNHTSCFVVNLSTGGWSRLTGWKISDLNVLDDKLYYADMSGVIFRADCGGTDDEQPIFCKACFSFDLLEEPLAFKQAQLVRGVFSHSLPFEARLGVAADYCLSFGVEKELWDSGDYGVNPASWDRNAWDQGLWFLHDNNEKISQRWKSVSTQGQALAIQLEIMSFEPYKLDCELISVDLVYSTGTAIA